MTAKMASGLSRTEYLHFSPPNISEEEIAEVVDTLRSGWLTTGPKTKQFEEAFARHIGAEAALAVNSCTAGLHIALAALRIGPGDEVITTPMTFISTVHVIEHVGATPVLVDIDPATLNLDPAHVERAITPRTKAILPVHYAGHPAALEQIITLAGIHGLYVIEDAAHALPAAIGGKRIGTIGDLTAFSFYATKNLTTGEGGMLTGAYDLIERARILSLHGMDRDARQRYDVGGSWYYEVVEAGFKYNMADIMAALGIVQLRRLEEMQERRRQIVARYNEAFSAVAELQTPSVYDDVLHAWHLYVLRLNLSGLKIDRAQFIENLMARNIGVSVHFIPVHLQPYYKEKYSWRPDDFPITLREYYRLVSLPLHSNLRDEDVEDVIAAVEQVVELGSI